MGRAPCCEKVGLNKGLWSAEEDEILRKYIEANGEGSWRSLPKNAGLKRCGKSCRLRWVNYLRGDLIRGNITSEEEDIIIKMHNKIGSRWSVIAEHLPGRTDNELKNYWNSYLSRRIYTKRRPLGDSSSPTTVIDIIKMDGGYKRKGQITSGRAARKKNNPREIPSNAFVEKSTEIGLVPSMPLQKESTLNGDVHKDSQNSLLVHQDPNIERENAGTLLNSSEDEIDTISWPSPFVNGEPENKFLGPYHGLESCMFADDIMDPSDQLSLNEVMTFSDGRLGGLLGSSNNDSDQGESMSSGVSLLSNGAAESTDDQWPWGRENVVEDSNHNLQTNEGDELLSWLWDNNDYGKEEEDMFVAC